MARVVEVELEEAAIKVAVYAGRCPTGRCFLLAYMWGGLPRLVVVPAQPSPFCSRAKLGSGEARLVAEALWAAYRVSLPYRLPVCVVPRSLLRPSLEESLEHIASLGIVEKILD